LRLQRIIGRAATDTAKWPRYEPADRSFSERPVPNGQLLLAAPERIMIDALRASTTTQMPRRPNDGAPQQNCNRVRWTS